VRDAGARVRVKPQLGQPLQGAVEALQVPRELVPALLRRGHQLVQPTDSVDAEGRHPHAAQFPEVRAEAEPRAEVVRQRA